MPGLTSYFRLFQAKDIFCGFDCFYSLCSLSVGILWYYVWKTTGLPSLSNTIKKSPPRKCNIFSYEKGDLYNKLFFLLPSSAFISMHVCSCCITVGTDLETWKECNIFTCSVTCSHIFFFLLFVLFLLDCCIKSSICTTLGWPETWPSSDIFPLGIAMHCMNLSSQKKRYFSSYRNEPRAAVKDCCSKTCQAVQQQALTAVVK